MGTSAKQIVKDNTAKPRDTVTDTQPLAHLISEVYAGNANRGGYAWHGDPLTRILRGVTAKQAAMKPQGVTHSIWELVLHITNWEEIALRRLRGERVEWVQDS